MQFSPIGLFEIYTLTFFGLTLVGWLGEFARETNRARAERRSESCPTCRKVHHPDPEVLRIKCRRCGHLFETSPATSLPSARTGRGKMSAD